MTYKLMFPFRAAWRFIRRAFSVYWPYEPKHRVEFPVFEAAKAEPLEAIRASGPLELFDWNFRKPPKVSL